MAAQTQEAKIIKPSIVSPINLQKKKNIAFYKILVVGFIFLAVFLLLTINLYPGLVSIKQSLLGRLETVCGCTNHWSFVNHPFIFSFFILAGLGLATILCFGLVKTLKLKKHTSKFIASNLKNRKQTLSLKLVRAMRIVKLKKRVIEINTEELMVFCFGFVRPRICISQGVVDKLSQPELTAVLLHEKTHLFCYEPIRIFIVEIITKILFFVPGLKLLFNQYSTFSELAADAQAVKSLRDRAPLAQALCMIMESHGGLTNKSDLAISFFNVTEERVNSLTNDNYVSGSKIVRSKVWVGILGIFFLLVSVNALVYFSRSINGDHENNACLSMDAESGERCQMESESSTCSMNQTTEPLLCKN